MALPCNLRSLSETHPFLPRRQERLRWMAVVGKRTKILMESISWETDHLLYLEPIDPCLVSFSSSSNIEKKAHFQWPRPSADGKRRWTTRDH